MSNNIFFWMLREFQRFLQLFQGIIQKKSVCRSGMLLLVIFNQKYPFFSKKIFHGKTKPKAPFLKILDVALKHSVPSV